MMLKKKVFNQLEDLYMEFYPDLYLGQSIKDLDKIKEKLEKGALLPGIYVLTLCKGQDQLEIIHAIYLKQRYYQKYPPYVIGIAKGYDEALEVLLTITKDSLKVYKDGRIRAFLEEKIT